MALELTHPITTMSAVVTFTSTVAVAVAPDWQVKVTVIVAVPIPVPRITAVPSVDDWIVAIVVSLLDQL
jgi:hypothetical protein